MAKKSQNEKMAPAPVAVATHEKTKRKSSLEVGFIAKIAIFGQKMPFCSPVGSVWQHIANPTPDSEFSEFFTIIKWC